MHFTSLQSSSRGSVGCFVALFLFVSCFWGPHVHARSNETTNFSEEDYAVFPQFCRARLERQPQELVDYWTQQLGKKNYLHIHHYCFGLKALSLAYKNLGNKQKLEFMANSVVGNFNYIIENTERTFFLRPEALLNLGRGHVLRQEYGIAKQKFEQAIKLNPKSADAWVALSDMYHQLGKKSDALSILEQASEICGENRKIDLRIAEMRSAGVKPSAAAVVPVQKPAVDRAAENAVPASETKAISVPAAELSSTPERDPVAAPVD